MCDGKGERRVKSERRVKGWLISLAVAVAVAQVLDGWLSPKEWQNN